MRKTTLSAITAGILLSATLFSGCESKDSEVIAAFDGKAVDGYLANAKVYYEDYENEARITDSDGDFSLRARDTKIILEPIYDDEGNCLTIDITTGLPFTKVLSAPAGYPIITPLTTVLAEADITVQQLAKALDINVTSANKMLKLDPVFVMNSDLYNQADREEATKIYIKGVVLENQLDILLSDKNSFDANNTDNKLDDKGIVLESFFTTILDENETTFDNISTDNLIDIYNSARLAKSAKSSARLANSAKVDISSDKAKTAAYIVASITSSLNDGLEDMNYTNANSAYNLSVEVGKGTEDLVEITTKLLETNSTSISDDVATILDAVSFKAEAMVLNAKVNTMRSAGEDTQELSAQAQSTLVFAQKRLDSTNLIKMNPAPTITNLVTQVDLNTSSEEYGLNITLSDFNLDGKDTSESSKYIARIENNDIISINNSSLIRIDNKDILNVTINSSGIAKLYITPIDSENKVGLEQLVTFSINDGMKHTPLELSLSKDFCNFTSSIKKEITLTIEDKDNDGKLVDVITQSNNENIVKIDYNKETNILSVYPITNGTTSIDITLIDANQRTTKKTISVDVEGISLPPVLTFKEKLNVAVKNSDESYFVTIPYMVEDPDIDDSVTLDNIISNNEQIECSDNIEQSLITCIVNSSVPKGIYTITATPTDGTVSGKAVTTEIKLSTTSKVEEPSKVNELDKLVSSLKVVPIFKDDTIIDSRYTMTNFKASYEVASKSIIINGDVTSDNDVSYPLSDMSLQADTNLSQFGGSDVEKRYALVVDVNVKEAGQSFNARALAFSTNGENIVPYTWALATDTEICNANFSDNVMNLINSSNSDVVNCTKD